MLDLPYMHINGLIDHFIDHVQDTGSVLNYHVHKTVNREQIQ